MTHVVTEQCIRCKYTDCVDVCPVDCFREGPNMLVIDPDECIDCAVCIPECPVNAIYAEEDVPADQVAFIKLNAELAAGLEEHHQAQAGAARCRGVEGQAGQALRAGPLEAHVAARSRERGRSEQARIRMEPQLNQEVIKTAPRTTARSRPTPSSSAPARSGCSRCSSSACWRSRPT